jgi:hypothetical protein
MASGSNGKRGQTSIIPLETRQQDRGPGSPEGMEGCFQKRRSAKPKMIGIPANIEHSTSYARAAHFSVSDDDLLGRVSIPEIHLVDMGQTPENRSDREKFLKMAHTAISQHRTPSWKPRIEYPAVVRDCAQSLLLHIEVSHCRRSSGGHLTAHRHRDACTQHPKHQQAEFLVGYLGHSSSHEITTHRDRCDGRRQQPIAWHEIPQIEHPPLRSEQHRRKG